MEVSKGAFRKFTHKPSMPNLSLQVASPLNNEDTFFSLRGTSRRNNQEERTCWEKKNRPNSSRAFVHFLCARATATPSFIENRTTQNVVGEPLPPTSWPHITAPQDWSDGCRKVCLSATATMTVSSVYFLV